MPAEQPSRHLLDEARRCDRDRYLCALLAPAERREALLTLILFDHELARIPEIVSQPVAGLIRLQWWREALDELAAGMAPRAHPVVAALARAMAAGELEPAALHGLIDAREPALERVAPEARTLEAHAAATSGALQALTYAALGGRDAREAEAAAAIGTAFGMVGLLSAVRQEAARSTDPMAAQAVRPALAELRERAAGRLRHGLEGAGRPERRLMAAFLPAALARSYLRQAGAGDHLSLQRPASMPLALTIRALLRRP